MFAQLTSFLFVTGCSFSLGLLVKKIAKWNIPYFHDFLIGFAGCNAFFSLLSLLLPINEITAFFSAGSLILLVFLNKEWAFNYCQVLYKNEIVRIKRYLFSSFISLITVTITFAYSLYPPSLHYDAGLYHIQTIKWISEYPAVKGLANLNYTFGYNFNIFSWYAVSAFTDVFQQPVYSVNLTLIVFFTLWIFSKINESVKLKHYFLAISFLSILYSILVYYLPHVSTTSTDIPVFILTMTILLSVVDFEKKETLAYPIIILSIYAVTVKLSAAPVLLIASYMVMKIGNFGHKREILLLCLVSTSLIIPWLIKNVLLTGWLLYPFPYIDLFSFEWKVPIENVVQAKETIKQYAQNGINYNHKDWIWLWLIRQDKTGILFILMTVVSSAILLLKKITEERVISQPLLLVWITSVTGIMYMFLNAPILSYCLAFFLAISILAAKVIEIKSDISKFGFYVLNILLLVNFLKMNWFHPWHMIKNLSTVFFVPYALDKPEAQQFSFFVIDSKAKCYYPRKSDQCFDQDLPCSFKQITGLHLIGKHMEQGFRIDLQKNVK